MLSKYKIFKQVVSQFSSTSVLILTQNISHCSESESEKKKPIHTVVKMGNMRKPDKEESSFASRQPKTPLWTVLELSVLHTQLSILHSQHCPLYLRIAATYKNSNTPKCLEYLIKPSVHLYNCNIKS